MRLLNLAAEEAGQKHQAMLMSKEAKDLAKLLMQIIKLHFKINNIFLFIYFILGKHEHQTTISRFQQ